MTQKKRDKKFCVVDFTAAIMFTFFRLLWHEFSSNWHFYFLRANFFFKALQNFSIQIFSAVDVQDLQIQGWLNNQQVFKLP